MLLCEGRLVPLPPKALRTLLVLVRNSGHVVEEDVLMNEVWPDDFVEEGNLAQNIFILRRALGKSAMMQQSIETVHGRGYRFAQAVREIDTDHLSGAIAASAARSLVPPPSADVSRLERSTHSMAGNQGRHRTPAGDFS